MRLVRVLAVPLCARKDTAVIESLNRLEVTLSEQHLRVLYKNVRVVHKYPQLFIKERLRTSEVAYPGEPVEFFKLFIDILGHFELNMNCHIPRL